MALPAPFDLASVIEDGDRRVLAEAELPDLPDVVLIDRMLRLLKERQRPVTGQPEDTPEPSDIRPFGSGDHCRMLMLAGVQLVQHWDCDEFTDGTYTRHQRGGGQAVVTAGTLRHLRERDAELKK